MPKKSRLSGGIFYQLTKSDPADRYTGYVGGRRYELWYTEGGEGGFMERTIL